MERGEKQYQEVLNFWKERLNNRLWRLEHLYWIKNVDGIVIPFRPNEVQRKFLERQHGRNAILKARQLGLSTLVGVLMADFVFWNENKTAAIIDWRLPEGQKNFWECGFNGSIWIMCRKTLSVNGALLRG